MIKDEGISILLSQFYKKLTYINIGNLQFIVARVGLSYRGILAFVQYSPHNLTKLVLSIAFMYLGSNKIASFGMKLLTKSNLPLL